MYIGQIIILCALIATALGAFMPIFRAMQVSAPVVFGFLLIEFVFSFFSPISCILLLIFPIIILLQKLHWGLGIVKAVVGGVLGAIVAIFALYFFNIKEAGLFAGILAGVTCVLYNKFARIRFCSGLIIAPIVLIFFSLFKNNFYFGFLINNIVLLDLACGAVITSFAISAILEIRKNKKATLEDI